VEEEGEMTSWASHDGGRLTDEKSLTIHHSRELMVRKMRRNMDTGNILGLEGRPLWSRLNYPLSNPIEESNLKKLVQLLRIDIKMN
jgi:hypothetical protein